MQRAAIGGRYALIEVLGDGDVAEVYLARDEVLDRKVALKILKDRYTRDEEFVERFSSEAESAARLFHPNIVSIYDQGRSEDGTYYVAMEYAPHGTLKDRIRRDGALDPGVAVGIALQIADALQAAHKQSVVHGDVKPQNVLLTRARDLKGAGDVNVTDFGTARAASTSTVMAPVALLDSAGYLSPEQAKGEPVGPRSDLYSLGLVLFEMLTGTLPFDAKDPIVLMSKHAEEPPRPPREANPAVPEALGAITLKLLAKSPEDRYASAEELSEALERARSFGLPSVASTRVPERRRGGARLAVAAAVLCVLVLLGGVTWASALALTSLASVSRSSAQGTSKAPSSQQKPEWMRVRDEIRASLDGKRPVPGVILTGTAGDDVLEGTDDRDVLFGSAGDDELSGYGGDDQIDGAEGNNTVYGGSGDDEIIVDGGNDTIYGGPGSDKIFAGNGDDVIDDGDDGVKDTIMCGDGNDTVTVGAEDVIFDCEKVTVRQK